MGDPNARTMANPSRYVDSHGLADAAQTMSPAHSRLQELSHRMTAVHDDFDAEKKARSSVMELKCRAIDEKIMRNKRAEDERLKPVYILIERLGHDITSERDHLNYLDHKLIEDVKDLEQRMNDEIHDQAGQRRNLENKITAQIDQACINLREDFAREKERRDESQKRREKKVADEILRITESLDIERKNRLAGESGIYIKMTEKLRDVENALLDERKGRTELETVFSEALEEKALIVQLEMAQEKKIRQENAKNTWAGFRDAMDRLGGKLQSEEEQRQADEEALIKKLLADINEVHNGIKCEGVIRARSESHIVQVLEEMCGKLQEEINMERKDRQRTEEVFMKLLDETCESIALRASSATLVELQRKAGN